MLNLLKMNGPAFLGVCLALVSPTAASTLFISPHGSGRDAELAGNTVASPDDGSSALQFNPAGTASIARDQATIGLVWFGLQMSYKNDATGYDGTGNKLPVSISAWYGLGEIAGWSVGLGAFGAVGTAFDLPADPDIGLTSPYIGELAVLNVGLNAAREVLPGLRIGAQITPALGRQRMRGPSPLGDVHLKVDGIGLSAMVGATYQVNPDWAVGLSYRSRGFIDMSGDASVGGVDQNADVDFVTPQMLNGGFSYLWTERLTLLGQLSWMRHMDFEHGKVEFQTSTALNQPVMSDTSNRLRWGIGAEYEALPTAFVRIGYTESNAAMKDSALMPMMFDNKNKMLMMGGEVAHGRNLIGFNIGFTAIKSRNVSANENPNFPGRYDADADMSAGLYFTRNLER